MDLTPGKMSCTEWMHRIALFLVISVLLALLGLEGEAFFHLAQASW